MIDTKALKQKILDLAMRGKLVPQDPNDEPVEELLARIREERRKLEKEKKISKVEESDIYWSDDDNCYYEKNDIPAGWSCLQLQYFSHIYTGNSLNEKEKNDLSRKLNYFYHYIATKDIDLSGNINYENGLYIPLDYNLKRAKQNSILICLEGANAGNKIGLIKEEVCFVNKLACVSPFIVMSKYIYYFFNSVTFNSEFRDNMQGIIGGIPLSKFKTLSILIPPLQEQERIVNKIDELFRLVDKIERDQQELEDLKKQAKDKVLELAVTGKLVKQDPNDEPASVLLERIKAEKEKLIKEGKIKRVASQLESTFRSKDYVFRIGGDEFAIIVVEMPSVNKDSISERLEKLKIELIKSEKDLPPVTISAGITFSDYEGENKMDVFRQADEALYFSKEHGKNSYSFYDDLKKDK